MKMCKRINDINWCQAYHLSDLTMPETSDGVMYPEFLPPPSEAELEHNARCWPAWLFDNETNYPLPDSE